MYYVYILRSITFSDQVYVGCTQDLTKRLSNHNTGTTPHTAKYIPWQLEMYLAFKDKNKAIEFEKYLKTNAGKIFLKRHIS